MGMLLQVVVVALAEENVTSILSGCIHRDGDLLHNSSYLFMGNGIIFLE